MLDLGESSLSLSLENLPPLSSEGAQLLRLVRLPSRAHLLLVIRSYRSVCCRDLKGDDERTLIDPDIVRDIVIGLSDGLTVPFALVSLRTRARREEKGER